MGVLRCKDTKDSRDSKDTKDGNSIVAPATTALSLSLSLSLSLRAGQRPRSLYRAGRISTSCEIVARWRPL